MVPADEWRKDSRKIKLCEISRKLPFSYVKDIR